MYHRDKREIVEHFNSIAGQRLAWKRRNRYYYTDQTRYFRFLVPEGSAILELGCGTGDLLGALRPRCGVGIDFSEEMLKIAKKQYPDLEFHNADIESLEYWGDSFDFIIMSDVIGHLQDIEETFRIVKPFCRADTRLIISYYNFLWEPVLKLGEILGLKMPQQHQNWLSTEDIGNLLSLADSK